MKRFWDRVEKTDTCWLWTGARFKSGYGGIRINGKTVYAHRFSWELENGQIPADQCILHNCDTPACVNPAHLSVGTKAQNSADMVAKRRQRQGTACTMSKLIGNQAEQIRFLLGLSYSQRELALAYGIGQQTVSEINRRLIWKELP